MGLSRASLSGGITRNNCKNELIKQVLPMFLNPTTGKGGGGAGVDIEWVSNFVLMLFIPKKDINLV
jgi:hypothetical protein